MKTITPSLIILLLVAGCSGSGDKVYEKTHGHNGQMQEVFLDRIPPDTLVLRASEVFSGFQAIPLETKEECLITNVMLTVSDDDLFVGTQNFPGPARLYRFDKKGRFLNEIGRGGKGPGEHSGYMQLFCHYYDQDNTVLVGWIGDDPQLFTLDGKLLKTIKMPFWGTMDMYRWNDQEWFSTGQAGGIPHDARDSFLLYFYTDNGKITRSIPRTHYPPENTKEYVPSPWENSVFSSNGERKIYFQGIDTVFTIQDKDLLPSCVIHHVPKMIDYNKTISPQYLKGRFFLFIPGETKNNLFLQKSVIKKADVKQYRPGRWGGAFRTEEALVIIDKKNGKGAVCKIEDDLFGFIPEKIFQQLTWHPDGYVSLYMSIPLLQEMIKDYEDSHPDIPPETAARLKPLKALHEEDNPVIFLFKLKDHIRIE